MKLLMKRRSVERIADTEESYKKLVSLGYVVKKDLEKENAADKEENAKQEGEKREETDTGAEQPVTHASHENELPEKSETAETEATEEPDKPKAKKQKKPASEREAT